MYRLAIVVSHVIQYQAPFFRAIAKSPEIDVHVFYCSRAGAEHYRDVEMQTTLQWDVDLLSGYEHSFLKNFGRGEGYARLVNPGVVPAILRGGFDAVVLALGWGTVTSLLALTACRVSGTPAFFYGDSSLPPAETSMRQRLRAVWMRAMFRLTAGFLVSGRRNAEYYRHYGGRPEQFFLVPYAADNERFAAASLLSEEERLAARDALGIAAGDLLVVYSAKLLERKDPLTLVRAVAAMEQRQHAAILFLGDGELRPRVEAEAEKLGVRVIFRGFVNQSDLPRQYAIGDVLVLPSKFEPWGLVVNEAMASGLPVIVSDRVGAGADLAVEGENGWTFPAGDVETLAKRLDTLAVDPALRRRMSERSRAIIAQWDYAAGVRGLEKALRTRC